MDRVRDAFRADAWTTNRCDVVLYRYGAEDDRIGFMGSSFLIRLLTVLAGVVLMAVSCSDADQDSTATTTSASTTSAATTVTSGSAATAGSASTATSAATATSATTATDSSSAVTSAGLPGVVADCCFLPQANAVLTVIGVVHDDVLNVRVAPGVDQRVVLMLDPAEDELSALGRHRVLPDSTVWYEIEVEGVTGWANARFLSYLGPSYDVTSDIVAYVGEYPVGSTMLEVGAIVADAGANVLGDPTASTVLMAVAPSVDGDLAEVTFEVLGLGDDSVWGVRLHIFGAPSESSGEFTLKSVEATDLCLRGGSPDGLCV